MCDSIDVGRRQEYSEYYEGQPEQQPRRYQQPPDDTVIYAPSQRVVDYIPQPDYGADFNYYGSDPQVQYIDGQQIPVTDEYLLAQQQYEDDLAAASECFTIIDCIASVVQRRRLSCRESRQNVENIACFSLTASGLMQFTAQPRTD